MDFGNCEILPTAELREIPIVFQVLPKQAILVEVDELKTMFPSAVEEFRNKMSQMAEKWTVYFKVRVLGQLHRLCIQKNNRSIMNKLVLQFIHHKESLRL